LTFQKNGIGSAGAKFIAAALESNSTLVGLDLKENEIGIGITFIANALTLNSTLTSINLQRTKIGIQGAKLIFASINNLSHLYLQDNELGV